MTSSTSLLSPTFTRPSRLRRALDSAFNQTLRPHEVVVIDDDSIDATPDVLAQLSAVHRDQPVFERISNRGPASARNRAFARARSRRGGPLARARVDACRRRRPAVSLAKRRRRLRGCRRRSVVGPPVGLHEPPVWCELDTTIRTTNAHATPPRTSRRCRCSLSG
jgi:glycosyltransferase involved in cell wall biosynthesis